MTGEDRLAGRHATTRHDATRMAHPEWEQMMGIAQKVSRNFSDAVRSRGQSYFVKGRVSLMASRPGEVVARVRGTAKYRVRVRLRGSKLLASCTCPYFSPQGEPCKHLWATLLLADSRNLLQAPPVFPLRLVVEGPRRPPTTGLPEIIGRDPGAGQPPYPFDPELGIIGLPPRPSTRPARGRHPRDPAADQGAPPARRSDRRPGAGDMGPARPLAARPPGQAQVGRAGPGRRDRDRRRAGGQGRQPQRQAAAGLRAGRGRHAGAEPGRHRPGPPPAQDDRRVGPATALVLRAPGRARQV